MKFFYTRDDVARWDAAKGGSVALHIEKLSDPALTPQNRDFHLGMLAMSYQTKGMILIAQERFDEARQTFRDSIETLCKMYERFEMGQGRSLEAGHFQSVLLAFVTNEPLLIARIVAHYRTDEGTPDSIFLGRAVKLLATGTINAAKEALAQQQPRFQPQFVGYSDCLAAIANKDQDRFEAALIVASESWSRWASKKVKGLPDSVCFVQGIGLVRLAERILGRALSIANEYMPLALLR